MGLASHWKAWLVGIVCLIIVGSFAVYRLSAISYGVLDNIPLVIHGIRIEPIQPPFNGSEQIIFYSHLPKAGGGTFAKVLFAVFGQNHTCPASTDARRLPSFEQFRTWGLDHWHQYRALATHEDWSLIPYIPVPHVVVTLIREPLKHRNSAYRLFHKSLKGPWPRVPNAPVPVSPEELLDFRPRFQIEWLTAISTHWCGKSRLPDEDVERIKRNDTLLLSKYALMETSWFGITERYNESLCLFFYTHRLPPKEEGKDWQRLHVWKESHTLYTQQEWGPYLKDEYEMFDFGTQLFDARFALARKHFRKNREAMQKFVPSWCTKYFEEPQH